MSNSQILASETKLAMEKKTIVLQDPESERYKAMLNLGRKWYRSGLIVNTFKSLDTRAVSALKHLRHLPPGMVLPPLYYIGRVSCPEGRRAQGGVSAWLPRVAQRATGPQHHVHLLRVHSRGEPLRGADQGDRRRAGEIRPSVPVGGARPQECQQILYNPGLHALLPERFVERTNSRWLVIKR